MSNPFDQAAEAFMEKVAAKPAAQTPEENREEAAPSLPAVRVNAPGEYDLLAEDYHADPCPEPSLSGSIIKTLVNRSPRHAWTAHPRLNPDLERKDKTTWDLGSVFHKLVLGRGAEIVTFKAENWTKPGNAGRDFKAAARKRNQIPILESQLADAKRMVGAVRAQIPGLEELAYAMAGGIAERTLVWVEETSSGPVWCRCMLDWIPNQGSLTPDWKSTTVGAGPDEWGAKTMWQLDGDIQAAWNRRAMKRTLGREIDLFFAVAEMEAPHALAIMRPTPAAVAMADRKIDYALEAWGACLKANRFPGYRKEMAWIDPPPWKEKSFLEREERGDFEGIRLTERFLEMDGEVERKAIAPDDGIERDAFGLAPIKGASE